MDLLRDMLQCPVGERVGMFTHEVAIYATLYPNSFWFFYINSHYESWQAVGILSLAERDTNLDSSMNSVAGGNFNER